MFDGLSPIISTETKRISLGLRGRERTRSAPDHHAPDGRRLFEHLLDQPKPLRLADLPSYLRSLGLSPNPSSAKTLQGTPMHHRGKHW